MARAQEYDWMRHRNEAGHMRPTKQRIARGNYRTVPTDNAGERYCVDEADPVIDPYRRAGWIDDNHVEAAKEFRELAFNYLPSPSQRSCLDFSPVGHDPEYESPAQIAQSEEWRDVTGHLTAQQRDVLIGWLWAEKPATNRRAMASGLDELCRVWKIGV